MYLVRGFTVCHDCGWEVDSHNAMGVAAKHHYKTGHEVHVEMTYIQIFGFRERASLKGEPLSSPQQAKGYPVKVK